MRLIFILITTFFLGACSNSTVRSDEYIDDEKLQQILVDLHWTDAIMANRHIHDKKISDPKKSNYNWVFKKYGVTREQFENNLSPNIRDTEELLEIYDHVLAQLDTMKVQFEKAQNDSSKQKDQLKIEENPEKNLWTKKELWLLPENGKTLSLVQYIKQPKQGIYTLKAQIMLAEDDSSIAPRSTIEAFYTDKSIKTEKYPLKKDNKWYNFEFSLKTDTTKEIEKIRCFLLDHSEGTKTKHAEVKDIKFIYTPYK